MKAILSALLAVMLLIPFSLSACDHGTDKDNAKDITTPYFVGKVIETNEKGFLLRLTHTGNGNFSIGETVQVNLDRSKHTGYTVGDHLRIEFDGKVALSYPPQVMSVSSVIKTDSLGNRIE